MQTERLDEPVKVRADFSGGAITPLAFKRGQVTHKVTEVITSWLDREGRFPRHHFSVRAENGDLYRLCLRMEDMVWILETVTVA